MRNFDTVSAKTINETQSNFVAKGSRARYTIYVAGLLGLGNEAD